jgi:putative nucleotidyltransferase-like protein
MVHRSRNSTFCFACPDLHRVRNETSHPRIGNRGYRLESVSSTCHSHGVRPLIYRSLQTIRWEGLAEVERQELSYFYSANSAKNRFLVGELLHLLQFFESEHILALPFEEPVPAAVFYGDLALREFTDLDILIRRRDVPKAREILLNRRTWQARLSIEMSTSPNCVQPPREFRSNSTPNSRRVDLCLPSWPQMFGMA